MSIYKQINQANHQTELNELFEDIFDTMDSALAGHIVPHAWDKHIVPQPDPDTGITGPATASSRDDVTIEGFVFDLITDMSMPNFHTKQLTIDLDADGLKSVRKTLLPLYINCSNTSGFRNKATAKDVGIIFIDLDKGNNPRAIFNNLLTGYAYIAWTTTAHQWDKGDGKKQDKIRIALFLDKAIPANTTFTDYDSAFTNWVDSSSINGEYKLDGSCTVISQPAIPPLYNQQVGYIELWANIGTGTKCFDLTTLTPISAPAKALKASTSSAKSIDVSGLVINSVLVDKADAEDKEALSALSDDGLVFQLQQLFQDAARTQLLLDIIKSKKIKSKYNDSNYVSPTNPHAGTNTHPASMSMLAVACRVIGRNLTKNQQQRDIYEPIAEIINDSSDTTGAIWGRIKVGNTNFAGWFAHVLTFADREQLELIGNFTKDNYRKECEDDNNRWSRFTTTGNWLSNLQYVTAGVTNSPFGTGKTHTAMLPANNNIIMGAPTIAITSQTANARCVTWNQIAKTADKGWSAGIDTVVIDEAHGIPLINYRPEAASAIASVIEQCMIMRKNIIFQSGTMDYEESRLLMDGCGYKSGQFSLRKNSYNPPATIGKGVSNNSALLTLIMCELEQSSETLVYVVRDKKDGNIAIAAELSNRGYPAVAIDADSVKAETNPIIKDFKNNKDFLMGKYGLRVVLVTRLGCEGVNVKDKIKKGVVMVFHPNIEHQFLKQSSGRFREADSVTLYHCATGNNMRYKDIDEVEREFDVLRAGISKHIGVFNAKADRFRDKTSFSNHTQFHLRFSDDALSVGYVWDELENMMIPAPWWNVSRYNHISQYKFYQSIRHQCINMEVFGCTIADNVHKVERIENVTCDISDDTLEQMADERAELELTIDGYINKIMLECYINTTDINSVEHIVDKIKVIYPGVAEQLKHIYKDSNIDFISYDDMDLINKLMSKKINDKDFKMIIVARTINAVQDIRRMYSGKGIALTSSQIMDVTNGLLSAHIGQMVDSGAWNTATAINWLNSQNTMWKGKVDSSGKFSGKYARAFLQDNGVLNFGKETTDRSSGVKQKVYPVK
jgi:hypothetical protein